MSKTIRKLNALVLAWTMASGAQAADAGKPQYGQWGVDAAGMDSSVRPGDDFFAYVNGAWLKKADIPADRTYAGNDLIIDDTVKAQLRAIVEGAAAAKAPPGSAQRQIGDLFGSFINEQAIAGRGLAPIRSELQAIDAIRTRADLAAFIGGAARDGVDLPIGGYVDIDAKNPGRYLFRFSQSGLSFGERDYYLKDTADFRRLRASFGGHVERLLRLAGMVKPSAQAAEVMRLETAIARLHWPLEKARDDVLSYNLWRRSQLDDLHTGYDWALLLQPSGLNTQAQFLVSQPDTLAGVARLIGRAPLARWQAYLRYHVLAAYAPYLPKAFDAENFAFYGTVLAGQPAQQERWHRGVNTVSGVLGEPLGQLYVQAHFPATAKADVIAMVGHLREALGALIQHAAWMSEDTRREARAKLDAFESKIGYPDRWRDYSALTLAPNDLVGNIRRSRQFETAFQTGKLDRPVDTQEWLMAPQINNAYYWPQRNEIVFPAGILQAPYYDPRADLASNYGQIGATIGHEMSHGFDDQGRKSDSKGVLRDWWTPADAARYTQQAQKLARQYDTYAPVEGLHINGQQTLGENIADLAGLLIAYDAYKIALGGKPAPVIAGLSGEQRFFLAFAHSWRTKYRSEYLRDLVVSDVHSPAEQRTNGVVRNVDAWYEAFGVQPGDALYLEPAERVRPW